MSSQTQENSLYERLGGTPAVNTAVEIFYDRILQDEDIAPFFNNTDLGQQRAKMKSFMAYAFGGIPMYNGKSLRTAHQKLVHEKGLNEEHFNKVTSHLQKTLEQLEVPEELIQEVMNIVGSTKADILDL